MTVVLRDEYLPGLTSTGVLLKSQPARSLKITFTGTLNKPYLVVKKRTQTNKKTGIKVILDLPNLTLEKGSKGRN